MTIIIVGSHKPNSYLSIRASTKNSYLLIYLDSPLRKVLNVQTLIPMPTSLPTGINTAWEIPSPSSL